MNQKLLKKMYVVSREANRNIQRLRLFVFWMCLTSMLKEAREQENQQKAFWVKVGLGLAALAQVLMIASDIRERGEEEM